MNDTKPPKPAQKKRNSLWEKEIYNSLCDALYEGYSLNQALKKAGFSHSAYYRIKRDEPERVKEIEALRNPPKNDYETCVRILKYAIRKGDLQAAKWYLKNGDILTQAAEENTSDGFTQLDEKDHQDLFSILDAFHEANK